MEENIEAALSKAGDQILKLQRENKEFELIVKSALDWFYDDTDLSVRGTLPQWVVNANEFLG